MTEEKKASFEVLGVETLTSDELVKMSEITTKALFVRDYKKSDAVLDLMKLFNMEDTPEQRRFTLATVAFGAAAESANRKMHKIMETIKEIMPEEDD